MCRLDVDLRFIVIPAKAGIQVLRVHHSLATLDARRSLPPSLIGGGHDGSSLRLKHVLSIVEGARNFNHPRMGH